MSIEQRYPSDLSDKEWALISDLMKPGRLGGRPPEHPRREIFNAIFYVAKTGCQWRYLPKNLPHRKLRVVVGKNEDPSVGIMDSQSIKTTEKKGLQVLTGVKKLKVGKGI